MLISDHTDRHEGPGNGEAGCRDDRRVCVRQGQAVPEHAGHIGDADDDYYNDGQEENDDYFSTAMIIILPTGDMIAAAMMLFIDVNAVTKWYYEE